MEKDIFKEYLRESEPDKAHKGYVCSIYFKVMANSYFRGRQYQNNSSVLHQIFKDTWILGNQ